MLAFLSTLTDKSLKAPRMFIAASKGRLFIQNIPNRLESGISEPGAMA